MCERESESVCAREREEEEGESESFRVNRGLSFALSLQRPLRLLQPPPHLICVGLVGLFDAVSSHESATFRGGGGYFGGRVPKIATSQRLLHLPPAHKKTHPPRTLPQAYAYGHRVVLGRWAFSYERGTPVHQERFRFKKGSETQGRVHPLLTFP